MRILITGASGFIGGRLRDTSLDAGHDVIAVRRKGSAVAKRGRSAEVDYDDRAGLERLVEAEKPDVVYHVAGATKGVTYDDFRLANVMPTENLVQALVAKHPGVKRFVLVSSLAAYGPSSPSRPLVESDSPHPIEHYGQSKLEAERAVTRVGAAIPWTILRPGGVYGPGDVDYLNLFREVEKGRNVFFGNRSRWFSAIYVDDLVDAILLSAEHEGARGKGFFVCDNVPLTWERFQDEIVRASGRKVRTLNLPEFLVNVAAAGGEIATRLDHKPRLFNRQKAKMGAQEAWTCKSDALRAATGWQSKVPVAEGVRRSFEWYRKEKWV
jgi:nucleoside-diphosphate-sugar epimerase